MYDVCGVYTDVCRVYTDVCKLYTDGFKLYTLYKVDWASWQWSHMHTHVLLPRGCAASSQQPPCTCSG